jgi:hypothetical protein
MSELCARLETIGIGQYGDAFDANESGTDLLEQVDDQLLKDIGVSIGGQIILARALMAAKAVTAEPEEMFARTRQLCGKLDQLPHWGQL